MKCSHTSHVNCENMEFMSLLSAHQLAYIFCVNDKYKYSDSEWFFSIYFVFVFQSNLYFNIGSVENFERSLEQCQYDLGVDPAHYVPVVYVKEAEWL